MKFGFIYLAYPLNFTLEKWIVIVKCIFNNLTTILNNRRANILLHWKFCLRVSCRKLMSNISLGKQMLIPEKIYDYDLNNLDILICCTSKNLWGNVGYIYILYINEVLWNNPGCYKSFIFFTGERLKFSHIWDIIMF